MSEQPTPPRIPLGKRLTEDELDDIAEMTPEHIRDAQEWWDDTAAPLGREMLRARGVVRQPERGQT